MPTNSFLRILHLPQDNVFHRGGTGLYLIGNGELGLIDTGHIDLVGCRSVFQYLDSHPQVGVLRHVFITHCHRDHVGGLADICRRWHPQVYAHPLAVGALENEWGSSKVTALADGDTIDVGGVQLVAIHTPGHSADHLGFFEPCSHSIFTGDLVVGSGTAMVIDLEAALNSLRKLLALDPLRLYPGHGPATKDGSHRIRSYISRRMLRERQLLRSLDKGPLAIASLVDKLYPRLDPQLHRAAENSLLAHLRKLENDGLIETVVSNDPPVYALSSPLVTER